MLPTILSHELMEGVNAFLRSTFPTSTPAFRSAFDEILHGVGRDRLFQGPYLRIGFPFKPGQSGNDFFKRLETGFPPYLHQEKAWGRLRTEAPKSTLVATGTGSGKTECFMYPVLDHVLANPSQRGIKAIILYPMNALATDQAKRFASEVFQNPACQGKVRVGLYVGGATEGSKSMTEHRVITCREEMRNSPPDILMTNYKMLDYLLIRHRDRALWAENAIDTLRYLVVDELHTFDGAQGTDLACLIRRVKARLKMPEDHLCCVGTSATLGGKGSQADMRAFAETVFGERFDTAAIIQEERKTPWEHIHHDDDENLEVRFIEPPGPEQHKALSPSAYTSINAFAEAQVPLWFSGETLALESLEGQVALAGLLRKHNFLRSLFYHFTKSSVVAEEALLADLAKRRGAWTEDHHRLILNSFLSLCAIARDAPRRSAYFLQIRSEVWMRELARMVASVSPQPTIRYSADLPPDHPQKHLAAMHCRDCGVMGWGAVKSNSESELLGDLGRFYSSFFASKPDPRLCFIFPLSASSGGTESLVDQHLCGSCLTLFESSSGTCPNCGTLPYQANLHHDLVHENVFTFPVEAHQRTKKLTHQRVADKSCPFCDSTTGLTIVGSRSASLTSVALSQLFGSPFNDDKKAMAFSDSVQDASHRAGFFTGRTYSIILRTALRQEIGKESESVPLEELATRFPLSLQEQLGPERFVGTFIPPAIEWLSEFDQFVADKKITPRSSLPSKVADRLEWEVIREFGMQSRIGRTLEKSGSAACMLAPAALDSASGNLLKVLREMGSLFSPLTEQDAKRLLMATSHRLRTSGGIFHRFLESYIDQKGNTYSFNNRDSLPGLPKAGRGIRPRFFATLSEPETFERLISRGPSLTWTERYVCKWLQQTLGNRAASHDPAAIIEAITASLTEATLWTRHAIPRSSHEYVWGLNPRQLLVIPDATHQACQACGHQITTATQETDAWKGMPCLRHKCDGTYALAPMSQGSFFTELYRKGDVVRLRAVEHTGMLDRPTREAVESGFMRNPQWWTDPNLLSCTPTMEMGVDVGDLSTVLLCSVPPEQANYLQRVGRGGRRDGNSLALTVATGEPHDLTYYEEPLKMLDGEVEMPAIFLRAPAVLERQLTAYCIDRWIESDSSALIPDRMDAIYMQLRQQEGKETNAGVFPNALYQFIERNVDELHSGFQAMFEKRSELDPAALAYLEKFIRGDGQEQGSLSYKINQKLAAAAKDRESLRKKRQEINRAIKRNKDREPRDELLNNALADMTAERKGISRLIRDFNDKQTLNFLTDEGLIPNYAFPEEGVTLRSVILKKPEKREEDAKLVKLEFEHMRAAESALTEFAPGASFYVEGRKLTVDRVSVDSEDFEEWHFCRSCPHVEPVTKESEARTECPRCHCSGWSDASLRRSMLKMRQVFVTAWDKDVRALDQKDDRELTAFNKQTSIDFQKDAVRKSYSLRAEGMTFAFDFIDLITLREVNFGEERFDLSEEDTEGRAMKIGGKHMQGIGFRVCDSCGKIQSKQSRDKEKHDISCKHFGKDTSDTNFENTFLLYRELRSEAIRLLIPSLHESEQIDTQSFVAAIHLGLRAHFGGHLNHLKLSVQHLPIAGGEMRSQNVFIYDTVPGGTGYLKDLTKDDRTFLDVLEKAYTQLKDCHCGNDPLLDGCYQCIRAYRFRFTDSLISRATALRQLKLILENRDAIEERSPDQSSVNPLLESELERRFIEALRSTDGFQITPEIIEGQPGFLLRVGKAAWNITPQKRLGAREGVNLDSKPDFLLKPLRSLQGQPIAVFLDGFAYHANVDFNNNRIADDMAKRNAIRMTDRYWVWSLTWADLKGELPEPNTFLSQAYANLVSILKKQTPELASLSAFLGNQWNSWQLFQDLLKHLSQSETPRGMDVWKTAASFFACSFPNRAPLGETALESILEALFLGQSIEPTSTDAHDYMTSFENRSDFKLVSAIPTTSLQQKHTEGALSALWFDDTGDKPSQEFRSEWQEFLRAFNLLQFVPRFVAVTKRMQQEGRLSNALEWLIEAREREPLEASPPFDEDQLAILEDLEESLQEILTPLLREGSIPWPEPGYEAVGPTGKCTGAMLELAWPNHKIGVSVPEDAVEDFKRQEWKILPASDLTGEKLRALF